MRFEVGVVGSFRARHHLVGDFGPASQPHEHEYRVEASVRGPNLQPDGTLFDITLLQDALAAGVGDLDGRNLNDLLGLGEPNPTAEVVARYLFRRVAPALAHTGLRTLSVRVWESEAAYAAYAGELT